MLFSFAFEIFKNLSVLFVYKNISTLTASKDIAFISLVVYKAQARGNYMGTVLN